MSETNTNDLIVAESGLVNQDINETTRNGTIGYANTLVERKGDSIFDWKTKELGLRFVIFGLAEVQAKRVQKLASAVCKMEEVVFSEQNMRDLKGDPRKQMELYQMGVNNLKEASSYIKSAVDSMDWSAVESQLIQIVANTGSDSNNATDEDLIKRISSDILKRLDININEQLQPQ